MPKTIYLNSSQSGYSGIDVTWTKSRGMLHIGGWYDGIVGISGADISLLDFFKSLGITEKDCLRCWKQAR